MQPKQLTQNDVVLKVDHAHGNRTDREAVRHFKTFGFSGIVESTDAVLPESLELAIVREAAVDLASPLSAHLQMLATGEDVAAQDLWGSTEDLPSLTNLNLSQSDLESRGSVALMIQMSLPTAAVTSFESLPQDLPRNHAHFVRSLIFWRNRNAIASMKPRLVHAGDDGSLVYILGSWLVALNWNEDEISIDIGDTGSMWLMLGTPRDVQLHGSLLVLPACSGAILANELAR